MNIVEELLEVRRLLLMGGMSHEQLGKMRPFAVTEKEMEALNDELMGTWSKCPGRMVTIVGLRCFVVDGRHAEYLSA